MVRCFLNQLYSTCSLLLSVLELLSIKQFEVELLVNYLLLKLRVYLRAMAEEEEEEVEEVFDISRLLCNL